MKLTTLVNHNLIRQELLEEYGDIALTDTELEQVLANTLMELPFLVRRLASETLRHRNAISGSIPSPYYPFNLPNNETPA